MSKTENVSIIKASDLTEGVDKLRVGMDGFLKATRSKEAFGKLISSEKTLLPLAMSIATFSNIDAKFEGGMKSIGKLCLAILKQDDASQLRAINKIAEMNNLEPTKDTGRKGLVYALFGKFPEMMKASGKDTIAGKRLSSYLAAGKSTKPAGPGKGRKALPSGDPKTPKISSAQDLFIALYSVASEKDQEVLEQLCIAVKFEFEDLIEEDSE